MAKYSKKFETWGGRELKAIINGKLTGVKHDNPSQNNKLTGGS